jgi:hypothetical protein
MGDLRKSVLALAGVALASGAILAGCGSDKPEFCDRVDTLRESVSNLTDIQLDAGVLDSVRTDLAVVETEARATADAARQDFPEESSALESSVNAAVRAVDNLPSDPSTTEYAAVALAFSAVANAVTDFRDKTESECE